MCHERIINMNEQTNHKVLSLWINDIQDSTMGLSTTANNSIFCIHVYYATIIKFYVSMYIQQNKCMNAIL